MTAQAEEAPTVKTDIARPIANPMIVLREEFDDHALLFDPDSGRVLGLNPVGVFIWKRLDGTRTRDDIVKELGEAYDETPADAAEDLAGFLQRLEDRGFVGYERPAS
jgi:SynChlorMet cassette protein ScmD